jgi:hypothetical protein
MSEDKRYMRMRAGQWGIPVFEVLLARSASLVFFALIGCAVQGKNPLGKRCACCTPAPGLDSRAGMLEERPRCMHGETLTPFAALLRQAGPAAGARRVRLWRNRQLPVGGHAAAAQRHARAHLHRAHLGRRAGPLPHQGAGLQVRAPCSLLHPGTATCCTSRQQFTSDPYRSP